MVKLLLANKASIKVSYGDKKPPLYLVADDSYESVKALLEKGANINITNHI